MRPRTGKAIPQHIGFIEARSWFPKNWFLPTMDEVSHFIMLLNGIRLSVTFPDDDADPSSRIKRAIEILLVNLPAAIAAAKEVESDKYLKFFQELTPEFEGTYSAALERLHSAAQYAYPGHVPTLPRSTRQSWHDHAESIGDWLVALARPHGIDRVSLTDANAPAIIVVQHALRQCGVHVERSGIVSVMKRRKRRPATRQ